MKMKFLKDYIKKYLLIYWLMFSIKYAAKAEGNLFEIYSYIAEDNPFMAAKVILQIKSSMEILKIFPLS